MPDKTPQIEKAARAINGALCCVAPDEFPCSTCRDSDGCFAMARAALSTTLEPSEAEIEAAAEKMYERDMAAELGGVGETWLAWWRMVEIDPLQYEVTEYRDRARCGLVAAARARVGE